VLIVAVGNVYRSTDTESRGCTSSACSRAGRSARMPSVRAVIRWPWNRRFDARRNRHRRLLTNNAKAAKTRSAAVGMETSSPVISVDLIAAGYGGTVPKALRL